LLLPSMLTRARGSLTSERRGRGTGIGTSAVFTGPFVCSLVVLAIGGALSRPSGARSSPDDGGPARSSTSSVCGGAVRSASW